jgi:hypothetical protein
METLQEELDKAMGVIECMICDKLLPAGQTMMEHVNSEHVEETKRRNFRRVMSETSILLPAQ